MSKIGKLPVLLPQGVSVQVAGSQITVTGPKGTMNFSLPVGISVSVEEEKAFVKKEGKADIKNLYGLTRATLANMVKGVSSGVDKKLELSGVGYRAQANGPELTLSVGFSHPVKIKAPEGITFTVTENVITVSGTDKAIVGLIAARVRAVRPPEPYKGKGIKYVGEHIRKKAGKAAKAVGGATK